MNSQRSQKRKQGSSSKQGQKPVVVTFNNLYKTMQPSATSEGREGRERTPVGKGKKPKRQSSKGPSSVTKLHENSTYAGGSLATQSVHGSMKRLDKIKPPLLKQNFITAKGSSKESA